MILRRLQIPLFFLCFWPFSGEKWVHFFQMPGFVTTGQKIGFVTTGQKTGFVTAEIPVASVRYTSYAERICQICQKGKLV